MEAAPLTIGYCVRPRVVEPDRAWIPESTGVDEICSFSNCTMPDVSEVNALAHFGKGEFYDESSALACLKTLERDTPSTYCAYAWVVLPTWYGEDGPHPGFPPDIGCFGTFPLSPGYALLGYDVVEVEQGAWGCSPLSCNGLAAEIPVNRFCLFDTQEAAAEVCQRFAGTQCAEPGDYVVVEVWRRTSAST